MAFDRPIEADKIRVEDFGLFSAFVHAPLWLLGGVLGDKKRVSSFDEEDTTKGSGSVKLADDKDVILASSSNQSSSDVSGKSRTTAKRPLHDDGAMLAKQLQATSIDSTSSSSFDSNSSRACGEAQQSQTGLKRTKKMSWSDESGQSLVEYANESTMDQSSPATPLSPAAKPIRSALKRSTRSTGGLTESVPTRYVPKMTRNEKGLIMPTRPYGGDPAGNGVDSPQWGWYTNITPPTPEMYQSYVSGKALKGSDFTGARSSLTQGGQTNQSGAAKPQHNQVFQNLRASQGPTMGWPSVPI